MSTISYNPNDNTITITMRTKEWDRLSFGLMESWLKNHPPITEEEQAVMTLRSRVNRLLERIEKCRI